MGHGCGGIALHAHARREIIAADLTTTRSTAMKKKPKATAMKKKPKATAKTNFKGTMSSKEWARSVTPPTSLYVEQIVVGKRIRKDLGDMADLCARIKNVGLLHPLVVVPTWKLNGEIRESRDWFKGDFQLFAGFRRLKALEMMKYQVIPVTVYMDDDIDGLLELLVQMDENIGRKDYLPTEAVAAGALLEEAAIASALVRKKAGVPAGKNPAGRVRDKIGKYVGMSGRTYEKAKAVVAAAEKDPDTFGEVLRQMDSTGMIDPAFREMKKIAIRKQQRAELAKLARKSPRDLAVIRCGDCEKVLANVPDGSVRLILTDPPYDKKGVYTIKAYQKLGRLAARLLKDDGVLLSYAGLMYFPQEMKDLEAHLDYKWMISLVHSGAGKGKVYSHGFLPCWKPILVFTKRGCKRRNDWLDDSLEGSGRDKTLHDWQQDVKEAVELVKKLARPGELVMDPFCGSGTVAEAAVRCGCRFVGSDIDAVHVKTALGRVAKCMVGSDALGARQRPTRSGLSQASLESRPRLRLRSEAKS
jgi:16S rRNA G966 N2-methylase RsmD